jgi:hypothetical protein
MTASAQTLFFDAFATNQALFVPPTTYAKLPADYYIVVDSITYSLTADTQGNYGIIVNAEDGTLIAWMERQVGDSETDIMHMSFPKGLIVHKSSYAPGTAQLQGYRTNIPYAGNQAAVGISGITPISGAVTVSYRYVHPAELGT